MAWRHNIGVDIELPRYAHSCSWFSTDSLNAGKQPGTHQIKRFEEKQFFLPLPWFHPPAARPELIRCADLATFVFFFRRWTSLNWKFWPSQRRPSTLLYLGHRLSNFLSSFDRGPVWCCPPIYAWVFFLVSWLRDSIWLWIWPPQIAFNLLYIPDTELKYSTTLQPLPLALANSVENSPFWETNRFSASQEIPCILWSLKIHYRIYKRPYLFLRAG